MTILQQNQPADGGPAFPSVDLGADVQPGMSLRDYFAAHAPAVPEWFSPDIPHQPGTGIDATWGKLRLFQWPYVWADAQLVQRAKGGQK